MTTMTPLARLAVVALLALASTGRAIAEPAPTARRAMSAAAVPYFERGSAHYAAGAFAQAIDAFERGQDIDPHPDFLYSLAQAYRRLGDCPHAIALYQAFLATRPPDDEADRARANLERCPLDPGSAAEPSPGRVAALPPTAAPGEAERAVWYQDVTGHLLAGAGLIGLGVGTAYLIAGERAARDANAAKLGTDQASRADTASRDRTFGAVCAIGGGALLAGAIVHYALHGRTPTHTALRLAPSAAGFAVSLEGRF